VNKPQQTPTSVESSSKKSYASIASNSAQQQTAKISNKNGDTLENTKSTENQSLSSPISTHPNKTIASNAPTQTTIAASSTNALATKSKPQTTNTRPIAQINNTLKRNNSTVAATSTNSNYSQHHSNNNNNNHHHHHLIGHRTFHNTNLIKKCTTRSNSNDNIENTNTNLTSYTNVSLVNQR